MEILSSLNGIVKILYLPFLLLIIGGIIIFVIKRHKFILKDKRIIFLVIAVSIMIAARFYFLETISSRFFSVLLIPTIPFAAYFIIGAQKYFNKTVVRIIFVLVLCLCIGKAIKPRRPKPYLKEVGNALNSIIKESKGSTLSIFDFSGEIRYFCWYCGFKVKNGGGPISKAPESRTQALFKVINSKRKKTDKVYFIFRTKGLEIARKKYFNKLKATLPLKEIFCSKAQRSDGNSYIIASLVVK